VNHDIEKFKARSFQKLAYCAGRGDVEFGWPDVMPIGLPLADRCSLEVGRVPGAAGRRPRARGLSILLFWDCPEEYYEAFPVTGENLHLRLSKVEQLSLGRIDDQPRYCLTKSAYPQNLPGPPLYNDRRRLVLRKSSILWLPLADRRAERVAPTTRKDQRIEIGRSISLPSCSLCDLLKSISRIS